MNDIVVELDVAVVLDTSSNIQSDALSIESDAAVAPSTKSHHLARAGNLEKGGEGEKETSSKGEAPAKRHTERKIRTWEDRARQAIWEDRAMYARMSNEERRNYANSANRDQIRLSLEQSQKQSVTQENTLCVLLIQQLLVFNVWTIVDTELY